ncbi:MAG: AI-2E family transporter [Thermoanaerobaculia bacterium]|nr:AI-2E family transporter [Thermoanaerobaculia bacterium]
MMVSSDVKEGDVKDAVLKFRGARILLVAASLVIVVAGLRAAAAIFLPLLFAIFFAVLSLPLLSWFIARRVPKPIAVVLTLVTDLAVVGALLLLVASSVTTFLESLPKYRAQLDVQIGDALEWLQGLGFDTTELSWVELPDPEPSDGRTLRPLDAGAVMGVVSSTVRSLFGLGVMALMVLLMMVFILLEAAGLPLKLQRAFGWREEDLAHLGKITQEVQHYLGIKTLISLATGILVGLYAWALGVDFALLWGLIAFVLNYIPSLGSILAAVPAIGLTMIDAGFSRALLLAVGYLVINVGLGNFLEPHLLGRRFGLSTLVVFLSLVFWGWVWGPLGMLLSVPIMMILKIMLENTKDFRWLARLLGPSPRPEISPER